MRKRLFLRYDRSIGDLSVADDSGRLGRQVLTQEAKAI